MPVTPRDDPGGAWLPPQQPAAKDADRATDNASAPPAGGQYDGSPPRSGSQPAPRWLDRVAVRSVNRIVIVPVDSIARLEAEDNYVRIWADRLYLHKETLNGLVARLDPARFLRVHRSHAVNICLVRELRPQLHGEYSIVLTDGTEITSGRSFKSQVQRAFGLA